MKDVLASYHTGATYHEPVTLHNERYGADQELSDKIHRSIFIEARLFAVLLTFAVVIKGSLSCRFFHLRTSTTAHPSLLFQTINCLLYNIQLRSKGNANGNKTHKSEP
ncbi:hypothetical protein TNCT_688511 [Trichonephila clavata]|uniref:Uncharacterized protein n=1 Tax=Trichonephila clavata TaxID=2740835 RepID=A0A8X6L298_TRICU|nr:hypothetical protein TNCT_688511 [Trichonephila clavata]